MDIVKLYSLFLKHPLISTDTRHIKPGSIFFALKGSNFNGNAFAAEALRSGAAYAVVDEAAYVTDNRFLLAYDALLALQGLARYHRQQLTIPVIGITGTNGKTTTKELLYAVLSQKYRTLATQGNLNNHIGVPLTILSITSETAIAIVEMGANHIGEIQLLCSIAQPDHGLITNVGKAHLEGFGSFEGVKKAKGELYDWLSVHHGTLFLQQDNDFLREMAASRNFDNIRTYGFSAGSDIHGEIRQTNPLLSVSWQENAMPREETIKTRLTGTYNAENVLAAVCAGRYFGVDAVAINHGIEDYLPKNNRSQILQTTHNTLICDYYNANASSMEAAIVNIDIMEAEQKVIILGDMFELGAESFSEHEKITALVLKLELAGKIFVGHEFYKHRRAGAAFYQTTDELAAALKQQPIKDALILLKASRGMTFEKLLPLF